MGRTTIIILIGIALIIVVAVALSSLAPEATVRAVPMARGDVRQFVDERGVTGLPETFLIGMPEAGRLAPLPPKERLPATMSGPLPTPPSSASPVAPPEDTAVQHGELVARMAPEDLELAVRRASSDVDRLAASIAENADTTLETTVRDQATRFAETIDAMTSAAETQLKAGREKLEVANRHFLRIEELHARSAQTDEQLDTARLLHVDADVQLQQFVLLHQSMLALQKASNLMPILVDRYIGKKSRTEAVLKAEEAAAAAGLDQAKLRQRRGEMRSPIDGVVLRRLIDSERFLQAGEPIVEIGRLEDLRVEADVLSVDVVSVKPGQRVEIYGPTIGSEPVDGTVATIYPAGFTKRSSLGVEQQRVTVVIDFDEKAKKQLLSERNLGVGYRVRVRIITDAAENANYLPRTAIFRGENSQWSVFAVRGGRLVTVPVEVGLINDRRVEIRGGLEPDDKIVVAPERNLREGMRVNVQ